MLKDCTRGSGCQYDHEHIWTSSAFINQAAAQPITTAAPQWGAGTGATTTPDSSWGGIITTEGPLVTTSAPEGSSEEPEGNYAGPEGSMEAPEGYYYHGDLKVLAGKQ